MGITWEIQQSTPTDAHKVVFTLMSLADSDTRSHWLDPGMQTHANKTHKTLMYTKKKEGDFIIYSEQQKNQAYWLCISLIVMTLHQPDSALSPWEGKSPEGSLVHTEAEQVELITQDSSAEWHEALQLCTTGLSTCHHRLDAFLHLAGAIGQTVLC